MKRNELVKVGWPDPSTVQIGAGQMYHTPDGKFPRVTRILKVLGLGTENLIRWSASVEREAVLRACAEVYADFEGGPAEFVNAVEKKIGTARQSQIQMQKAADIGTSVHQAVHAYLRTEMGLETGPFAPSLPDQGQWAFMAWEDWWKKSGLKPVRMEQPVWDPTLEYAGTIDLLAEDPKLGLGVVDLKTSKGIWDEHHLQVAAYLHAANNFAEVKWAKIVRVPKVVTDPEFEVKELGQMYKRTKTYPELMRAFCGALEAYKELVA